MRTVPPPNHTAIGSGEHAGLPRRRLPPSSAQHGSRRLFYRMTQREMVCVVRLFLLLPAWAWGPDRKDSLYSLRQYPRITCRQTTGHGGCGSVGQSRQPSGPPLRHSLLPPPRTSSQPLVNISTFPSVPVSRTPSMAVGHSSVDPNFTPRQH